MVVSALLLTGDSIQTDKVIFLLIIVLLMQFSRSRIPAYALAIRGLKEGAASYAIYVSKHTKPDIGILES